MAVNRKTSNDEQQTMWVCVTCWNKLANVTNGYLKTSSLVQIQVSWMRWGASIDREGNPQASVDLTADRLVLLDHVNGDAPMDTTPDGGRTLLTGLRPQLKAAPLRRCRFFLFSRWHFSQVMLESRRFSQVTVDFSHNEALQNTQFGGFEVILFSSYAGTHKSGAPQASLDLDANRLVLLDRLKSDDPESGEDIPF